MFDCSENPWFLNILHNHKEKSIFKIRIQMSGSVPETKHNKGIQYDNKRAVHMLYQAFFVIISRLAIPPRGRTVKRFNQQNDSFPRSVPLYFPFSYLSFSFRPDFSIFILHFSVSRRFGTETRCNRMDVMSTRLPLTSIPRLGIIVCSCRSDRWTEATRQPYNDAGKSNIQLMHVPVPFYASWIQFRAFPRQIKRLDPTVRTISSHLPIFHPTTFNRTNYRAELGRKIAECIRNGSIERKKFSK